MNARSRKAHRRLCCLWWAALLVPALAGATDGYIAHGYGMKSIGMGGASIARTDDAFGGANNPAQMVFVGDRIDLGLNRFAPFRGAERTNASIPTLNGSVDSESTEFWIPEFGYNALVRPDLSLGVSLYGNGGMNTDYPQGSFGCVNPQTGPFIGNMLCGQGRLGVDLMQLVLAPTVAYKVTAEHAIGVSPLITYQRFKIEGVQFFGLLSTDPNSLTNKGYDNSRGIGVRVGYLGKLSPFISIGAQYASKTSMSKFDSYKGLFADAGGFDLPSNYGAGVALHPTPGWNLAFDYERILYSGVSSVNNPSHLALQCASGAVSACLGGPNGIGFGWQDVNVFKVGIEYALSASLTLRAGYNHSSNPIRTEDVTFNILAPGVVQDHFTVGATHPFGTGSEVTAAFMYAPTKSVSGSSLFSPLFQGLTNGQVVNAGGTETIRLREMSIGLAWGRKL
jgi:long-chain fatty acid transport protein